MMAQSRAKSTRDTYNYGQYINQFPPNTIKVIREFERIQKKICRHKMSIMFNEICIYIYIYIYIQVCARACASVWIYVWTILCLVDRFQEIGSVIFANYRCSLVRNSIISLTRKSLKKHFCVLQRSLNSFFF